MVDAPEATRVNSFRRQRLLTLPHVRAESVTCLRSDPLEGNLATIKELMTANIRARHIGGTAGFR